ncbi:hypothetical protein CPB83DRAFT_698226 [Crepidotus variabilis]|uniref:Uncharacterized protein n=1 Tax=Crepidotus variabilis TaxID=179855 RepID=A0A9P6E661_9AGAR|nr:hypothetical protein CPB83DRAFT_698226 [Crepidotus variabilis]
MFTTCQPQPTQIPFDLYEVIVEELFQSNNDDSLKFLSLACHNLLGLCQRRIFRNITISWSTSKCIAQTSRLWFILSSSPHLLSYIRGLHCSISTLNPHPIALINIIQSLQHKNVEEFSFDASSSLSQDNCFVNSFIPTLQNFVGNTKIRAANIGNLAELTRSGFDKRFFLLADDYIAHRQWVS